MAGLTALLSRGDDFGRWATGKRRVARQKQGGPSVHWLTKARPEQPAVRCKSRPVKGLPDWSGEKDR